MTDTQPKSLMDLPNELLNDILLQAVPKKLARLPRSTKRTNETRDVAVQRHHDNMIVCSRFYKLAFEAFFPNYTHDLHLTYGDFWGAGSLLDRNAWSANAWSASAWSATKDARGPPVHCHKGVATGLHRSPVRYQIQKLRLVIFAEKYAGNAVQEIPALLAWFEGLREAEVVLRFPNERVYEVQDLKPDFFASVKAWEKVKGDNGKKEWERKLVRAEFDCRDEKFILEEGQEFSEWNDEWLNVFGEDVDESEEESEDEREEDSEHGSKEEDEEQDEVEVEEQLEDEEPW
ncbi:hypothetical protein LTR56_002903 [Elasticomyces elasticus]|nr:hypothetical protein LTR56_002903 [Elasticomyces elasticus]KAK4930690.1 hypothetical protein LTR49_002777 [Elasticomyces elasticus]KAK5759913.1 hypothetical protein LTS12_009960 [Elasticomyces elasticus]